MSNRGLFPAQVQGVQQRTFPCSGYRVSHVPCPICTHYFYSYPYTDHVNLLLCLLRFTLSCQPCYSSFALRPCQPCYFRIAPKRCQPCCTRITPRPCKTCYSRITQGHINLVILACPKALSTLLFRDCRPCQPSYSRIVPRPCQPGT